VNKCWECDKTNVPLHNHHPVPKSRGGTRTIPLCEKCHKKAHHRKGNMNISALTKEGFRRKREREPDWKPGNPNWRKTIHKAWDANQERADANALNLSPVIDELRSAGLTSYRAMARALNARGIKTPNKSNWHGQSVKNLIARIEQLQKEDCQ